MVKMFIIYFTLTSLLFCPYSYSNVYTYRVQSEDGKYHLLRQYCPDSEEAYWELSSPAYPNPVRLPDMPVPYLVDHSLLVNLHINGIFLPPDPFTLLPEDAQAFTHNWQIALFFLNRQQPLNRVIEIETCL